MEVGQEVRYIGNLKSIGYGTKGKITKVDEDDPFMACKVSFEHRSGIFPQWVSAYDIEEVKEG